MLVQEINVGGVIKGNKVALLYMAKQGKGGVIINTSSTSGKNIVVICVYWVDY